MDTGPRILPARTPNGPVGPTDECTDECALFVIAPAFWEGRPTPSTVCTAMGSLIKKRRKRMRKKKHKKLLRRTRHQRRARGK